MPAGYDPERSWPLLVALCVVGVVGFLLVRRLPRVGEALDAAAEIGAWEEQLEQLQSRIQRLGPINLAAIEEFQEQSERMHYLDAQYQDITRSSCELNSPSRFQPPSSATRKMNLKI